jgi:hypothetical protein
MIGAVSAVCVWFFEAFLSSDKVDGMTVCAISCSKSAAGVELCLGDAQTWLFKPIEAKAFAETIEDGLKYNTLMTFRIINDNIHIETGDVGVGFKITVSRLNGGDASHRIVSRTDAKALARVLRKLAIRTAPHGRNFSLFAEPR